MAEDTKIEWATHTFNPWRGCTKVSAGCANCYAETMSKRNTATLGKWGPSGTRVVASEAMWRILKKWNKEAEHDKLTWEVEKVLNTSLPEPSRPRVFCASLCDIFEDWGGPMVDSKGQVVIADRFGKPVGDGGLAPGDIPLAMTTVRRRLYEHVNDCPNLDFLFLTKRPNNAREMLPDRWLDIKWPKNVWMGASVEDDEACWRINYLKTIAANIRFLSVEPLLGPIDLAPHLKDGRIHWVIVGGESGPHARSCNVGWIRKIVADCQKAGVAVFVKQLGAEPRPSAAPLDINVRYVRDKKGGDIEEWPEDLQIRQFPTRQSSGASTATS